MEWLFKDYSKPAFDSQNQISTMCQSRLDGQPDDCGMTIHSFHIFHTLGDISVSKLGRANHPRKTRRELMVEPWLVGFDFTNALINAPSALRDAPGYQPESPHPWDAVASSEIGSGLGFGRYPPLTKPTGGRNRIFWPEGYCLSTSSWIETWKVERFFLFRFYVVTLTVEQMKA